MSSHNRKAIITFFITERGFVYPPVRFVKIFERVVCADIRIEKLWICSLFSRVLCLGWKIIGVILHNHGNYPAHFAQWV